MCQLWHLGLPPLLTTVDLYKRIFFYLDVESWWKKWEADLCSCAFTDYSSVISLGL